MKTPAYLALVICASAATGCAMKPDCLEHQSYMDAKSFPPLQNPAGLDVPEPDPSMRIPDVASGPVGTYDEIPANVSSEDPAARCLITPPPIS